MPPVMPVSQPPARPMTSAVISMYHGLPGAPSRVASA